jgi:PAS domain S-box-containing protein
MVALVVGGLLEALILLPIGDWHDRYPGVPSGLAILVAVGAAAYGGTIPGVLVAIAGWSLFYVYVADQEVRAAFAAPAWIAAAAAAGVLAERLLRHRRRLALVRRELAGLQETSSEAIVAIDREGTVVGWSPAAATLYGYAVEEIEGRPLAVLAPEDRAGEVDELLARIAQGEAERRRDAVQRHKDGSELVVSRAVTPLRDVRGGSAGALLLSVDATRLRRAEEEKRDLERTHRSLVERLPLVPYTRAVDGGGLVEVAPQIESLLGYSPAAWRDEAGLFERLLHPDDRSRVLSELKAAVGSGKPFRADYRMLARDGRVVWLHDEATVVRDAQGAPLYRQGYVVDAGELKRAEAERNRLLAAERAARADSVERQRRLDFLAEASDVLASSLDYETTLRRVVELAVRDLADWCVVDVQEEDGTLKRLAVAHAEPRPDGAAQPGSEPEAVVRRVVEAVRAEIVPEIPGRSNPGRSDGLPFASYMCAPLVARGRALGAVSLLSSRRTYTADDLSLVQDLARRAALAVDNSRLYREVEERADAARVLAYVGDGVFLLDRAGVIRLWNPAAEAIIGLTSASVLGHSAAEVIPGWQSALDGIPVASSPEPSQAKTIPLDTTRGERWISISGVEFFGGTVYAFRDFTEEHRLDELKAEFVATASHELRTPLAAVYGAAQTLRRHDFALDESGRERFVSLIVEESERLGRIVNEILLANQLDAGRLELASEPFDPSDLAERVVEAVRTQAPPGVALQVAAPPVTPTVKADRDKVRQVLINLLENAIKYSPDGGRIEIGLEPGEGTMCFSVRDEGLGIPAEEQERIFEKFYRLDPDMTRGVGGTGLGLYICSELIDRMGGHIWVESQEGQGSTFFFDLPLAEIGTVRASVATDAAPGA